jgi:TPR repeat protein
MKKRGITKSLFSGIVTLLMVLLAGCGSLRGAGEHRAAVNPADPTDAIEQYNLGLRYFEGTGGLPQDYEQAVYWYRKAAEQEYAQAQHKLGGAYAQGNGVDQNYEQAVYWYRKAAEQEYAQAQSNLGVCYAQGIGGLSQDYEQAVYWFRKAAEQGDAGAQYNLGSCYAQETGVGQD